MSGTREGGLKAAQKNLEKDPDFYIKAGRTGGTRSTTGGFFYSKLHKTEDDPSHPKNAGLRGGKISKRGKKVTV